MLQEEGAENPQTRKRTHSGDEGGSESRDEETPRTKRRFTEGGIGSRHELRLLVQSQEAGTIIGKGGDNIKRLRTDYKASIQVSDNRGPERIATVSSDLDTICDVLEDLLKCFAEKHHSGRMDEGELRMIIHQSQAGCVIGKAGAKLKDLRQEYEVEIKVFAACCPMSTDRIVKVVGTPEKVITCIVSIVDLLRTWPPKGYNNPYDPLNFDSVNCREYGGYPNDSVRGGGGGGRFGGDRFRDREHRGGGDMYGGRGMDRGRNSRMGGMGGGGGGGSPMGYPVDAMRGMPAAGPVTTQQVSIPADLAGVIIGKGGQRIKQIREDSGAGVELSDSEGVNTDRIITITGTLQQIRTAQYLLQQAVKQHLDRS